MDEPVRRAPHLRVVDGDGQIAGELCPHCHETDMALRSERSKVTKLKNELARAMGMEHEAEDIIAVLEFSRQLLRPGAAIVAGSDSWKAVRARLRDRDISTKEPAFDVLKLKAAVVGVSLDEWHMDPKHKHRRDPAIAFSSSDKVTRLIQKAVRFKQQTGTSAFALLDGLGSEALLWLSERCSCGHTWLAHLRGGEAAQGGAQRCSHDGCGCELFDAFHAKVERFIREQE